GTSSRISPSRLPSNPIRNTCTPVILPPGLLRLATKPSLYWIKPGDKDNRNGRGRCLGCECGWRCKPGDHRYIAPDPVGSHGRKPVALPLCPRIFDGDVAAVPIPLFAQPPPKGCHHRHECIACSTIEKTDHWHRRLLRARHERPCRRAAEQRDELAPPCM